MLQPRNLIGLVFLLSLGAALHAQIAVTTSGGTANAVPVYTSSSTLGNSPMSINGNRVGIGTPNPEAYLNIQPSTDGLTSLLLSQQNCVSCGWSMSAQNDGAFRLFRSDGPSAVLSMLYNNGNVGIGTTAPASKLDVIGGNGTGISIDPSNGTTIFGTLGFNREAATGNIFAPTGFAYQFSNYSDRLQLEVYRGDGTYVSNAWAVSSSGAVGIGTTSPAARLEVNGGIKLTSGTGGFLSFSDNTVQSTAWTGVLSGGDYAESVNVSGNRDTYEPGDVLVIDPSLEGKFLKSSTPYATTVTGIYSTKPGVTGRRQHTSSEHMKEEVPMAMTGIVPTKVTAENGPIKPGDLLVSSSIPGYAMKGTDRSQMLGAVIGKAIGHLDAGTGVIEAVVTLQ